MTKIEMLYYKKKILLCYKMVLEYFNGDHKKTKLWFKIRNPLLGGCSARRLIENGRVDTLLKFIINAREGNMP